jgi:acylphosphatase
MVKNRTNEPDGAGTGQSARLHAMISGLVQGVGFRAYVQSVVTSLELTGWVRNTAAGDVEVVIEGPQDHLVRVLGLLHRGPRSARVVQVEEHWEAATGEFQYFSIRPTGYDH